MAESNVRKFYPKNAAENPDAVLEQAVGKYDSVLVLGWGKDGWLDPRASTNLNAREINYLIDIFKNNLLNGVYSE